MLPTRVIGQAPVCDLAGAYQDRVRIVELEPDSTGALLARADDALWIGRFDDATADAAQAQAFAKESGDQETADRATEVLDEINTLAPDILWLGLGVPAEQKFVRDFGDRLTNVGVIKTSGGLFDHLSGKNPRAPRWLQRAGFEWLWRMLVEPRRLFWRYLTTNPRAFYCILRYSR